MAINLKAYFFAAQAVIPGMQAAGGGSIVNLSSISYMMGNGGYPAYAAPTPASPASPAASPATSAPTASGRTR
jgi:galactose dehydrogenase